MQQVLCVLEDAVTQINDGKVLLVAGEEALLRQLPRGNWIGGTIPYFITAEQGGVVTRESIFVTDISDVAAAIRTQVYSKEALAGLYTDAGNGGFSCIIIPASSSVHTSFALNSPNYKNFGSQPLVGWIAGVHLDNLNTQTAKVFLGASGEVLTDDAVVMHVDLAAGKTVDVGIVNLFAQGDGDILSFEEDGFSCTDVMVNGARENFGDYISRKQLDTKLPLVADYYGALINISFQDVVAGGKVSFYAPVFSGIRYKHAKPVADYASAFIKQLETEQISGQNVHFSCNCILNYLYSGLEGKKTSPFAGPVTFGEIAYQLLNQTLVYLQVMDG